MSSVARTVFFYGLFMEESILAQQGVHAEAPRVGCVAGFRLAIGERATLVPDPAAHAWGVVMDVDAADLKRLYAEPGVADYEPEPVTVTLRNGETIRALCYNLPAQQLAGTNPNYAQKLLALARQLGLPGPYLKEIIAYTLPGTTE